MCRCPSGVGTCRQARPHTLDSDDRWRVLYLLDSLQATPQTAYAASSLIAGRLEVSPVLGRCREAAEGLLLIFI